MIQFIIAGAMFSWFQREAPATQVRVKYMDMIFNNCVRTCLWSQTSESFKQKDVQWWVNNIERLSGVPGKGKCDSGLRGFRSSSKPKNSI